MTIKAILFDLDDTILNQKDASIAALKVFHKRHCNGLSWEDVYARWSHSLQAHFETYARGEITFKQQRRRRIRDLFENQDISDESADNLFSKYLAEYEINYSLFPEVRRVLGSLGKYPMAVITNGNTYQQHDKISRMKLEGCFQAVLISEEVGIRKPDPKIFELAASRLNVQPNECIFIGDNYEADYKGSLDAGMVPVLIERREKKFQGQARRIQTFDEIPDLIVSLSEGSG